MLSSPLSDHPRPGLRLGGLGARAPRVALAPGRSLGSRRRTPTSDGPHHVVAGKRAAPYSSPPLCCGLRGLHEIRSEVTLGYKAGVRHKVRTSTKAWWCPGSLGGRGTTCIRAYASSDATSGLLRQLVEGAKSPSQIRSPRIGEALCCASFSKHIRRPITHLPAPSDNANARRLGRYRRTGRLP